MPQNSAAKEQPARKERTENAARRRGQLIDAALRSIVKHGLAGTTLATVAKEARLSQGVAVFYFQTKEGLLAAALERHYERYQANWQAAREATEGDPASRLAALVGADFAPAVCSREAQIVWHAFWGEASARPLYNEIADRFDSARSEALEQETQSLLSELKREPGAARALAAGIEALTDGLWLQIYLASGITDPVEAKAVTGRFLVALFPERAAAFAALG